MGAMVANHKNAIEFQIWKHSMVVFRINMGECVPNCGGIHVLPLFCRPAKPTFQFLLHTEGVWSLGRFSNQCGSDPVMALRVGVKVGRNVDVKNLALVDAPGFVEQETCVFERRA
jgi:hypothetical protein